jgi:hypothetical protein
VKPLPHAEASAIADRIDRCKLRLQNGETALKRRQYEDCAGFLQRTVQALEVLVRDLRKVADRGDAK